MLNYRSKKAKSDIRAFVNYHWTRDRGASQYM